MMAVRVRVFARLREVAGAEWVTAPVAAPATVGAVRAALVALLPGAAALLPHCVFALDGELAHDDAAVGTDADLACLPPVSGG